MKKKILSLILVLVMLPLVGLFAACKDKSYNLNKLDDDFYAIAKSNNNMIVDDEELVFDFSGYSDLNQIIKTTKPYSEIKNYNTLYENIMSFVFEYIDDCSNNKATNNNDAKAKLKSEINSFKKSVLKVNENIDLLGIAVNTTTGGIDVTTSTSCLYRLRNLLDSYEDMFVKAGSLSNNLSTFYFKYIEDSAKKNPFDVVKGDYTSNRNKFEPEDYISGIEARCKYQISNLTQSFVSKFVGEKTSEGIVESNKSLDLNQDKYASNVSAVNKNIDEASALTKVKNNTKAFYLALVAAYNTQSIVEEEYSNFRYAIANVSYRDIDKTKVTSQQKLCLDIIDAYSATVADYNLALVGVLSLIGV